MHSPLSPGVPELHAPGLWRPRFQALGAGESLVGGCGAEASQLSQGCGWASFLPPPFSSRLFALIPQIPQAVVLEQLQEKRGEHVGFLA